MCPKCSSKVIFSESLFNGGIISLFCLCGWRAYNFLTLSDIAESIPYKIMKCKRCHGDIKVKPNTHWKKHCRDCTINLNRKKQRVRMQHQRSPYKRRRLEAQAHLSPVTAQ